MALNLAAEYLYSEPATPAYPHGSFKNASTGSAGDGTPVDKKWANDIYGFLQALLTTAGIVPSGAPDTAQASQYLEALRAVVMPIGRVEMCMGAVPAGWLELNGTSIGSADSGATGRANADTLALYTYLWPNAANTVQTAGGVATGKGASAAADFAANKRLVLTDARNRVPRGLGTLTDGLGSVQEDAIQNITGTINSASSSSPNVAAGAFYVDNAVTANSAGDISGAEPVTKFDASLVVRTADETRVKSFTVRWIIRY